MIFITGGVRSGKSAFAEHYAQKFGDTRHYTYVATGMAFDEEMAKRITRHQQDRAQQTVAWTTVEMDVEVPLSIQQLSSQDVVLFECVTTWLSNALYKTEQQEQRSEMMNNYIESLQKQFENWQAQGATIIVVSNEVLDELPSRYEEVNWYRALLGNFHQWLVAHSTEAYEVQFQLVTRWK